MDLDVAALTFRVLALGGLIGLLLGAVGQWSRFCTMGALTDLYTFGEASRMRMWLLAALIAIAGTQGLLAAGVLQLDAAVYLQPRLSWLSHLLGGAIFGAGMVLASGCATRSLVRAGAGSLRSLVVLGVVAVSAQMSLRGAFAGLRVDGLDRVAVELPHADLPRLLAAGLDLPVDTLRLGLVALLLVAGGLWILRGRAHLGAAQWIGGGVVGLLIVAAWVVTGLVGHLPEHPETLEAAWVGTGSRRPEGLSFVAPIGATLAYLELASDQNTVLNFGIALVIGTLLGSAASARLRREFRWETFANVSDTAQHLVGAVLMGFGGVLAVGCTFGQGLSGLSLLTLGAPLALVGFAIGSYAAWRYLSWRLERAAVVCGG